MRDKMRKSLNYTSLVLAVILIPSPATAAVYINCTDLGNGVIEFSYDFSEEPVLIRAFAFNIRLSNGRITSIGNLSPYYWAYPGSIEINAWGEVVDWGTPAASGPCAIGGLGKSGMTIEMGSLYAPVGPGSPNAPPPTGVLFTFTISAACNITVEANVCMAGTTGVVFENPEHTATVYAPGLQGAMPPDPEEYGGGIGTEADPFLIYTAEQFNTIGLNPADLYKHFKLMADIDLSCYTGTQFNLIGTYYGCAFRGTFNGNGHRIHNFIYNSENMNFVGLFGYVDGDSTEIKDLDLIDPNVTTGTGNNVGSLVGYLRRGTVSRCSVRGGTVTGDNCVGGLIGRNYTASVVNCFASTGVLGNENLGGLVGRTYVDLSNCYSTGGVSQYADLTGGLAGFNHGNISASFWDTDTSNQLDGVGGTGDAAVTDITGRTTSEMKIQSTFTAAGWDFEGESANGEEDIWTIREGKTYPILTRQIITGDFVGLYGVNMADFAYLAGYWGKISCGRCGGADLTGDENVDKNDLKKLAENWLAGL
jgi:hypothetical protein